MSELKIPEIILRERRKMGLTQEELAEAMDVSSQAISNWERGGYPDITLLPRIANFFGITVDELIGNDDVTKENDIQSFWDEYAKIPTTKAGCAERLALAKKYHAKYPQNYDIMDTLGDAIVYCMDKIESNMSTLREIHEKIMSGCTYEKYRRNSMHRMCYVCGDDELEEWINNSELDFAEDAIGIGAVREERYKLQERFDVYRSQRNRNDILIFMHLLGRNKNPYYLEEQNSHFFEEPARVAAWECLKMRFIESLGEDGAVPEAWCGCYAEACLVSAAAMIGSGRIDEGFEQLERAFPLYERWIKIPDGKKMDVGNRSVFGHATVTKVGKNTGSDIFSEDGRRTWSPYMWLVWQLPGDIARILSKWVWFDGVRDDERYIKAYERAESML